jgi:hypothetical protein
MTDIAVITIKKTDVDEEADIADACIEDAFERTPSHVDPAGVLYSMFCAIVYLLVDAGWTGEELARDVRWHATDAVIGAQVSHLH